MKKIILGFVMILASMTPYAQGRKIGVGVLLGAPTALSGKFFLGGADAIDAGLSFSSRHILVFGDYLRHFPGAFGRQNEFVARLSPYVGLGPLFAFNTDNDRRHDRQYFDDEDDNFAFGGRIPLGVEWMAQKAPIGVSLELVPGLVVIPRTDAFFQAGLAVRYYF